MNFIKIRIYNGTTFPPFATILLECSLMLTKPSQQNNKERLDAAKTYAKTSNSQKSDSCSKTTPALNKVKKRNCYIELKN